jgi:hypothetical protein
LTPPCLLILVAIIAATSAICQEPASPQAAVEGVTFREPFKLKLHVDKERYYEQEFPKIPYVYKNEVYLFKVDTFGVDLAITNGFIQGISYQSDTNKAAVSLQFTQVVETNGDAMMLLVIKNHTEHKLFVDALMTVPERQKPLKTSIMPVEAGLSGFESWPHPIVQLVLRNIRLKE